MHIVWDPAFHLGEQVQGNYGIVHLRNATLPVRPVSEETRDAQRPVFFFCCHTIWLPIPSKSAASKSCEVLTVANQLVHASVVIA